MSKGGWKFAALLTLGLAVLVLGLAQGAAAEGCSLSIVVAPSVGVAVVTATVPDAVTFSGAYDINPETTASGTVHFTASVTTGWVVHITPEWVTANEASKVRGNLTINVVVPAATLSTEVATLRVDATATIGAETCSVSPWETTVTVREYGGPLMVSSDRPFQEIAPGAAPAPLTVRVSRQTNNPAPRGVFLGVDTPAGISSDAPSSVRLDHFENGTLSGEVSVNLTVSTRTPNLYTVQVTASEAGNLTGTATQDTAPVFIRVAGPPAETFALAGVAVGATAMAAGWVALKRHKARK